MLVATGKVRHATVEVKIDTLPEGATVTVIAPAGNETFELRPEQEAMILAAIREPDAGKVSTAAEVLARIRRR
jgi:hypothetical protein